MLNKYNKSILKCCHMILYEIKKQFNFKPLDKRNITFKNANHILLRVRTYFFFFLCLRVDLEKFSFYFINC